MNSRLPVHAWVAVSIGVAGLIATVAIAGDPKSDLFQPDVFATQSALERRAAGLDPLGRTCGSPSSPLTFAAAVDAALCNNPTTRTTWVQAREQAAALGSAESAWLPTISGTGDETRTFGEHADITGEIPSNVQNTRDAALNLSWILYDFGGRDGRITSARHLLDAAVATASASVQQTVVNVAQAYYGLVADDALVVAAQTAEADSLKALEVARGLSEGGAASLADVLQAETAYDQAVLALVQAQSTAQVARGAFSVAIGLPADRKFTLNPDPVPAEAPRLSARIGDLMSEATRQRPDLIAALSQRDAAVANVTVARAVGRPSITVSASRNVIDTPGVPHENYGAIGVNVTVPIFTGFNVDYGVRSAQAALELSEENISQVRLTISQGVWSAYYSLDSSNQQLTVTSSLVHTAEKNEEVALGRYQGGVDTILDVITAQSAAALARQTQINAELGWEVARAQLAFALGRLSSAEPLSNGASLP
jgi:outer membrane protein TolC